MGVMRLRFELIDAMSVSSPGFISFELEMGRWATAAAAAAAAQISQIFEF